MNHNYLNETTSLIAQFYEPYKVGYEGSQGYRKSSDLAKLAHCIQVLGSQRLIDGKKTIFADLGCADGRVNILMSYFVKKSIGIEIDHDMLSEFTPWKKDLCQELQRKNLNLPPDNIHLVCGNSLEPSTYERISDETGVNFSDIDLFYNYITLHDLFAEKIAREAKSGALYLVYGFHKILPQYKGLNVVIADVGSQGIAALYNHA